MESVQFSKPTSMLAFSIRTYESQAQYHKLELTVLRKKIDGAKQRCLALGDTHSRPELILFSSQSRWDCWWVKTLIVLCSNSAWQAKWLRWRIRILGGRERDRQKDRGVILWRAASQNCQGPLKKQSTKIFLSNPFTTNIHTIHLWWGRCWSYFGPWHQLWWTCWSSKTRHPVKGSEARPTPDEQVYSGLTHVSPFDVIFDPIKILNGRCLIPLPDKRNFEEVPPQHDFEAWETPTIGPWFEEKLHWSCHKWVSRFSLLSPYFAFSFHCNTEFWGWNCLSESFYPIILVSEFPFQFDTAGVWRASSRTSRRLMRSMTSVKKLGRMVRWQTSQGKRYLVDRCFETLMFKYDQW